MNIRHLNWRTAGTFSIVIPAVVSIFVSVATAGDLRVYDEGKQPNDRRLEEPKHLNNYFPFEVPDTKLAWEKRAEELRLQVRIATGVWPMPEKTPLNPVLHGKVQRDGFTVEKVYFESMPNHFVTGLLFRPDDGKKGIKRPAVLCPHGHGGRLQDYGEKKIKQLIVDGAERFEKSGRYPKLARCAQLARMGCVTFIFDMLGYADSGQITYQLAHRFAKQRIDFEGKEKWGLYSTQAELRLQSIMGIQTWNSIRCLDFLESLPDVDASRLAVTGGSGGGTQTILLCAIDSRPIAAFPNGMVSTSMQGGCTCENCSLLRIGTGNVELAGLFAPKPQAMTAANDWTREMMTKGFPELQQLYEMVGATNDVMCYPQLHFPHNYNYVTRAHMYSWFNKHLKLGLPEPVVEDDYEPLTSEEHSVWNAEHPKPEGGDKYERSLIKYMAKESDKQIRALTPKDAGSLRQFREVVGSAFRGIIGRGLPNHEDIIRTKVDKKKSAGYIYFEDILRLEPRGEEFPIVSMFPISTDWTGDVVIYVDDAGKRGMFNEAGEVNTQIRRLLDNGASVVGADLFQQGEFLLNRKSLIEQRTVKNTREFAGYTFGYNDTAFARRVHDVLTLISFIKNDEHAPKRINLLGVNGGGPIVATARAISGKAIGRAALDTKGFRFADLTAYRDPNFLPGAVKYGDLPSLLALSAPHELWFGGENGKLPKVVASAYAAAKQSKHVTSAKTDNVLNDAVDWLIAQ